MGKRFLIAILFAALAACNTTADLSRGQGTSFVVEGKSYDQIWKAAHKFSSYQLALTLADKETGTIKGEKPSTMWSAGEVVGVFITKSPIKADIYIVEVQNKKVLTTNIMATDWTTTFINGIKLELEDAK